MNKKIVMITFFAFLSIAYLFPLKIEAALHPSLAPQSFCDSYNLSVEYFNQRSINSQVPHIESLTQDSERSFTAYFDDILLGGKLFIHTDSYKRITSISVSNEINGYTQINGKTVPQDIMKFTEIGVLILGALGYPTSTNSYRQRAADVFVGMINNYDANIEYSLYNPVWEKTYLLGFRANDKYLCLRIAVPN